MVVVVQMDLAVLLETCRVEEKRSCEGVPLGSLFSTYDTNDDGVLDFVEFSALCSSHPWLLYPVLRLQERVRHATLGTSLRRSRRFSRVLATR